MPISNYMYRSGTTVESMAEPVNHIKLETGQNFHQKSVMVFGRQLDQSHASEMLLAKLKLPLYYHH